MAPLVSIIIPIFNNEISISETVRSIRNQSYKNIEIILVDNGSLDSSIAVLEKQIQHDSRIKVYTKDTVSFIESQKFGLKVAKGTYVMFFECEKIMSENLIEYFIKCLEKEPADIIDCDFFTVSEYEFNGTAPIIKQSPKEKIEITSNTKYLQKLYSSSDHTCEKCAILWNKLINRIWLLSTQYHANKDKINISYNFLTKKSKILTTNQILICNVTYDNFLKENCIDLSNLDSVEFLESLLIKYKKEKLSTATYNTAERLLRLLLKLRNQTMFFAFRYEHKEELKQNLNKKFNSIFQFLKLKYPDKEKKFSIYKTEYLELLKAEKFREKYFYLYPDYLIKYEAPIIPFDFSPYNPYFPYDPKDEQEFEGEIIEYFKPTD